MGRNVRLVLLSMTVTILLSRSFVTIMTLPGYPILSLCRLERLEPRSTRLLWRCPVTMTMSKTTYNHNDLISVYFQVPRYVRLRGGKEPNLRYHDNVTLTVTPATETSLKNTSFYLPDYNPEEYKVGSEEDLSESSLVVKHCTPISNSESDKLINSKMLPFPKDHKNWP